LQSAEESLFHSAKFLQSAEESLFHSAKFFQSAEERLCSIQQRFCSSIRFIIFKSYKFSSLQVSFASSTDRTITRSLSRSRNT
jgi:hypothetical protein